MKISMTSVALVTLVARKIMLQNISLVNSFYSFQLYHTFDYQFATLIIDNTLESPHNEFFQEELPSMTIPQKRPTETKEFSNYSPKANISEPQSDVSVESSHSNSESGKSDPQSDVPVVEPSRRNKVSGKEAKIPNVTFKNSDDVMIQSKIQVFSNVMNQFKEGLMEENEAREISEKLGISWDNFIGFFKALELHKTGVIDENEFRDASSGLGFGLNK